MQSVWSFVRTICRLPAIPQQQQHSNDNPFVFYFHSSFTFLHLFFMILHLLLLFSLLKEFLAFVSQLNKRKGKGNCSWHSNSCFVLFHQLCSRSTLSTSIHHLFLNVMYKRKEGNILLFTKTEHCNRIHQLCV